MSHTQPDGFLAVPETGTGPGVLVLHAWWGLNETIKVVCTRLAQDGFVAFAPDLYHGQVADTIPGAEKLGGALDANYKQAQTEVLDAARFLSERVGQTDPGLAVLAFSLGGFYALQLARADPEDIYETQANVDSLEASLRRAGRPVTFYRYPGTGHWFFEPDRVDVYNAEAASLAWERTLAFLKQSSPA